MLRQVEQEVFSLVIRTKVQMIYLELSQVLLRLNRIILQMIHLVVSLHLVKVFNPIKHSSQVQLEQVVGGTMISQVSWISQIINKINLNRILKLTTHLEGILRPGTNLSNNRINKSLLLDNLTSIN